MARGGARRRPKPRLGSALGYDGSEANAVSGTGDRLGDREFPMIPGRQHRRRPVGGEWLAVAQALRQGAETAAGILVLPPPPGFRHVRAQIAIHQGMIGVPDAPIRRTPVLSNLPG